MVNMTCPVVHRPSDPVPFINGGDINFKAHDVGWIVSGFLTLIATCASVWLIWKHLTYYTCPPQQRHIVRMLIMVPIYAIVSFLSYIFFTESIYYETIRDCYEAVVITSFFYLLLQYVGDTPTEQHEVFKKVKITHWFFPLGFWKYRPEGLHFLWLMKICILQYAIVRPVCTLAAVGLQYFGLYCLESWAPQFGHIYISIIISISVSVAMYCIIQFYLPIKEELKPYSPVLKFLAVKSVVFLTFWQSSFLSVLAYFNVIKDTEYMSAAEVQVGINALMETFEMVIFGFLHIKAFTYLIYRPEDRTRTTRRGRAMLDVLDFRDWYYQMSQSTRYVVARSKGKPFTIVEDIRRQKYDHLVNALGHERKIALEMERESSKVEQPTFWSEGCEPVAAEDEELLNEDEKSGATPSTSWNTSDVEKKAALSSATSATPSQANARTSAGFKARQSQASPHRAEEREERRPRGNMAMRKDFDPEKDPRDLDADPSEEEARVDGIKDSIISPQLPQLQYNADEKSELRSISTKKRTRDAYPELTAFHAIVQDEDNLVPELEDDQNEDGRLVQKDGDGSDDEDQDGIFIPRKGGRARKEASLGLGAFWRKFRERISGTQDDAEGVEEDEEHAQDLEMPVEDQKPRPPNPVRNNSDSSDASKSALQSSDSPLSQFINDQRSQISSRAGALPASDSSLKQARPPQIQTFSARQTPQIGAVEAAAGLFAGSTPALSRASSAARAADPSRPEEQEESAMMASKPEKGNKGVFTNVLGSKTVRDSFIQQAPERQPPASVHPSVGTLTSAAVSRSSLPLHGPLPAMASLSPIPTLAPVQPLTAGNLASNQVQASMVPSVHAPFPLASQTTAAPSTVTTEQRQLTKDSTALKRTPTSKDVKGRKISLVLPQPLSPDGQLPPLQPLVPQHAPPSSTSTTSNAGISAAPRTGSKIQFAPESTERKSVKKSAANATTLTKSWRDDPEAEPPKYPLGRVVTGGKSLAQVEAEHKAAEEEAHRRKKEEEERVAMEQRMEAQRRHRREWEKEQERQRRQREQGQIDAWKAKERQQQQQQQAGQQRDSEEGGSTIRANRPRRSSAPVAPPSQQETRSWLFGKKKAKEPDPFTFLPAPSLMLSSSADLNDPFAAGSSAIHQQQQHDEEQERKLQMSREQPRKVSNVAGVGASGATTSRSRHLSLGMIPPGQTYDIGSIVSPGEAAVRHHGQVKPYPPGVPRPYDDPRATRHHHEQHGRPRPNQQAYVPHRHAQHPLPPPHHSHQPPSSRQHQQQQHQQQRYDNTQQRPLHYIPKPPPPRQFSAPSPGERYWAENGYSSINAPPGGPPQVDAYGARATAPHANANLPIDQQQRRMGRRASYNRYTGEPSWIGDGQQQQPYTPHHPSHRQQDRPTPNANGRSSNRAPQRPDPRGTRNGYEAPENFRFDYID